MFLVSSCSCLCLIYWNHVLSCEWRCSWSSADRRCSNYIWVINQRFDGTCYKVELTLIQKETIVTKRMHVIIFEQMYFSSNTMYLLIIQATDSRVIVSRVMIAMTNMLPIFLASSHMANYTTSPTTSRSERLQRNEVLSELSQLKCSIKIV